MSKYYCLYNNKKQEKLLTTAPNEEKLLSETEYYISGTWFSYDTKEGSNLLSNEKEMKGVKFPEVAKQRDLKEIGSVKKSEFKWVV